MSKADNLAEDITTTVSSSFLHLSTTYNTYHIATYNEVQVAQDAPQRTAGRLHYTAAHACAL